MPKRKRDGGAEELLVLPVNHTWMMRDKRVISAAARFLKTGRFETAGGGGGTAAARTNDK